MSDSDDGNYQVSLSPRVWDVTQGSSSLESHTPQACSNWRACDPLKPTCAPCRSEKRYNDMQGAFYVAVEHQRDLQNKKEREQQREYEKQVQFDETEIRKKAIDSATEIRKKEIEKEEKEIESQNIMFGIVGVIVAILAVWALVATFINYD